MERLKKREVVSQLKNEFENSQAVFVAGFKGLDMVHINSLRLKVRQAGSEFHVAKNTLVKLAAKDNPVSQLDSFLVGNNAISYTKADPAALAKVLCDFAKDDEKFSIKGGILGGSFVDSRQIQALASLPSREVLLSTLLGSMKAVPATFVRTLAAVPQKLLYALVAIRDQKEAA